MTPNFAKLKIKRGKRVSLNPPVLTTEQSLFDINMSVLYVSHSLIPIETNDRIINKLVIDATYKNRKLSITGALIATGSLFAQYLEGNDSNLMPLLDKIRADARHDDMIILRQVAETKRRFASWSLAYSGLSPLVTAIVNRARISNTTGSERGVRNLIIFMERFAVRTTTLQSSENQFSRLAP